MCDFSIILTMNVYMIYKTALKRFYFIVILTTDFFIALFFKIIFSYIFCQFSLKINIKINTERYRIKIKIEFLKSELVSERRL